MHIGILDIFLFTITGAGGADEQWSGEVQVGGDGILSIPIGNEGGVLNEL